MESFCPRNSALCHGVSILGSRNRTKHPGSKHCQEGDGHLWLQEAGRSPAEAGLRRGRGWAAAGRALLLSAAKEEEEAGDGQGAQPEEDDRNLERREI